MTLVKPYYRENAGLFVFVFTMMFFIVNKVDGAELLEYHYSLILGTLKSSTILALVMGLWLLYTRKCIAYVAQALHKPEYAYMHLFTSLPRAKQFWLFLLIEFWLLLPISLYAVAIIIIGLQQQLYIPALLIIGFFLLVTTMGAARHLHQLNHPTQKRHSGVSTLLSKLQFTSYPSLLMGFVSHQQKAVWVGSKVFTCGLLYLIARNNTVVDYDNEPIFLFFSIGILAHAVLIHRIRAFEESYLSFYRSLAVPPLKRFLHYALVYAVLLLPEFITLYLLTPVQLHVADAICFGACGYGFVLLMNSITIIQPTSMKEFLKILSLLFFVQYFFLLTIGLAPLYLLVLGIAILLFWIGYWKYEPVE
jgi:hypothetical protein